MQSSTIFRLAQPINLNLITGDGNWVRSIFGRKSVPKGYANHLAKESAKLEDLYHIEKDLVFDGLGGKDVTRSVVFANCEQIVDKVCNERGYLDVPKIIINLDGGGGFFKICATILPEDHSWGDDEDSLVTAITEMESPVKKKRSVSTYAEGGTMEKGLVSGMKRVIPFVFVPDIKETHKPLTMLVDLCQLNRITFKIVATIRSY